MLLGETLFAATVAGWKLLLPLARATLKSQTQSHLPSIYLWQAKWNPPLLKWFWYWISFPDNNHQAPSYTQLIQQGHNSRSVLHIWSKNRAASGIITISVVKLNGQAVPLLDWRCFSLVVILISQRVLSAHQHSHAALSMTQFWILT